MRRRVRPGPVAVVLLAGLAGRAVGCGEARDEDVWPLPGTYVVTDAEEAMLVGASFAVHEDHSVRIDYVDDVGEPHVVRLRAYTDYPSGK